MQLSNIPGKLVLPFASTGNKNSIPVNSQIGVTPGAASLADGFPPLTMTPVAAGGVPPSGLDMNGILFQLSAILRWANAGGGYAYDSTFANDSNVNGYPKGARIMRSDGLGYWFNTTDNNTTDPEAAGAAAAGWVPDFTNGVTSVAMASANVTLTPLQYGKPIIVITGTLTANLNLIFPAIVNEWTVINNTTGPYTITCKTAAGTGVVVNTATLLVGDGTNIQSAITAEDIPYMPAGNGAVLTDVQTKLRELVSLADFNETAYHMVRVPSEYPTLQAAFDALAPGVFKSGQFIEVLIETGHALTHGLELTYGDYSHFKISSIDPVVTLSTGMVFVGPYDSTLWFDQCHAPIVNIKIDAAGAGGRTIGYTSAHGKVESGKGALNAGTSCLYLNSGSFVDAFGTVWEGSAGPCAWVSRASLLDAEESSFSNSTASYGITVRRGSTANITNSHVNNNSSNGLFITRSYVNFQGREDASGPLLAECNNNGADGVSVARGSRATLTGLQAINNINSGIVVYSGSIADCDGCESTGNGVAGVRAFDGGIISANAATLTGNNRAIICEGGASSISAPNADLSNSVANAIQATNGARVSAVGATGTNCGGNTVDARDGANVTVTRGTFTGSGAIAIYCQNAIVTANSADCTGYTTYGIRASSGSIYFQSGNARKAGSDTTTDIEIGNGSIIHASEASGGYAATVTPNTISGTRGILFK